MIMWEENEITLYAKYNQFIYNYLEGEYDIRRMYIKNFRFVGIDMVEVKYYNEGSIVEILVSVIGIDDFIKFWVKQDNRNKRIESLLDPGQYGDEDEE